MTEPVDLAPISMSRFIHAAVGATPSRMTMSPPPSEPPVMPPPRAVAMRAKRATSIPTPVTPGNGPLRMTMSIDHLVGFASNHRWTS